MVHVLVNVGFDRTVRNLMETCDGQLDSSLTVLDYPDVLTRRRLPGGTYVFTDFERCTPGDLASVNALWDQLSATRSVRLLNDPRRVLWRYPLLREFHALGLNDFTVYRPADDLSALRFPVFLRCEHDHGGVRTDLLHTPDALRQAIRRMRRHFAWRTQILITEFSAVRDADGFYRKYGALLVEGRILPCQLMASEGWFVKGRTRLTTPATAAEEYRYVEENPHADALRDRFARANIEYGRIDYGFVDGRLQVYEINTNPTIVGGRGKAGPPKRERRPKRKLLTRQLVEAFREMDAKAPGTASVPVTPRKGALPSWAYRGVRRVQSFVTRVTQRSGIR